MGGLISVIKLRDQYWPPATPYSAADIPDLKGKIIIVTGSNTGIGKETAKHCIARNARVYLAARSKEKTEAAIQDIKNETGKEGIYLNLDLGDLNSVRSAAEEFLSKESELHVLFNNAGVMMPPRQLFTAQDLDLQFGTNVLGHFYFTSLLLPALIAGAKSSPDGTARIVNTSSTAHEFTTGIDFNTLKDSRIRNRTTPHTLYAQSKLGNILVSNELARRYGSQGIVSTALNPGAISSDLVRHMGILAPVVSRILWPVSYGALTQLWAGTSREGAELNGKYLIPWARIGSTSDAGKDPVLAEELWKWCEEHTKNF